MIEWCIEVDNMTRKEFVEKLFNQRIFTEQNYALAVGAERGCQGFECADNDSLACNNCEYYGFWNKEINMTDVLKSTLNMLYGTECQVVIGGRGVGKTHAIERSLELSGWQRFPRILDTLDFESIRDIVDDALDNGFEFKVFNSTLYYREKGYANTDSAQDVD